MSSDTIRESAAELAWSLWTELGVPGISRNHAHTVIDPEPLIIATPTLAAPDPRLLEQAFGWCAAHSNRISVSRLKGLLAGSSEHVVARFSSFSGALRSRGAKWPIPGGAEPWSSPAVPPSPPLPIQRQSLLRFRLRALCGVGARADVLCELLTSPGVWRSAADLARLGYTKRNVAKVLSELDGTGIIASRMEGNALRYRLARSPVLRELVGLDDLAAPAWQPILGVVLGLLGLLDHEAEAAAVQRVEANKLRDQLVPTCQIAGLDLPPPTRGDADAWGSMQQWSAAQVHDLADGTSSVFGHAPPSL
jgi:hypothetical protein